MMLLIDVRSSDDYALGHHGGATHIPAQALFERMHELPQRHVPLRLCGDAESLAQAQGFLSDRGYQIEQAILWTHDYAQDLKAASKLELGAQSQRLWQSADVIQAFVSKVSVDHVIKPGRGLDIACGSGRDMVYLALHGWQMTGLDYNNDAVTRARALATFNNVDVDVQQRDLENTETPFSGLTESYELITVLRYLHRPLLPQIADLLAPGGVIVYQTFMQGCEKISSPRNARFLLAPNELKLAFSGFEIIKDETFHLDDGRPVSAFVARKPL